MESVTRATKDARFPNASNIYGGGFLSTTA
jgi:hypothetical protein